MMTKPLIRVLDMTMAVLLMALAAVPMALIALAIRLSDGGPALFRQVRVGQGLRPFTVVKFRTMRVDRPDAGQGTLGTGGETLSEANARFVRTMPGDARITPLGRVLRPSHLDELPQIFNILRGDMSFVGVRPDTPVQEGDYTAAYWQMRHRYRPGLTGPAQLRRDPLDFAQRNAEEMRWLENYSLAMYLKILWRTLAKVLHRSSF